MDAGPRRIDFTSRAAATYEELATSLRDGASDVAWLPPVVYAWHAEAVTPIGSILREGDAAYAAAIVVREGSPFQTLADLDKVRAGWVDPWSAAGYVVPRLELSRAKVDPRRAFRSETFHGSHRDALVALSQDVCDVVGTHAKLPSVSADDVSSKPPAQATAGAWSEIDELRVRVLATSGAIPPDVIAVRRNLGPREHEQVIRAFRDACQDEAARPLVRAVFGGDELREGLAAGHDELRRAYEAAIARGLFD